jgi:hypothetical protein
MSDKDPYISALLPDEATVDARRTALAAAARDADSDAGKALRHGRPALAVAAGALIVAAAAAAIVLLTGGSSRSTPAYGAELVRFAESTPLLLLEGPDWRVENVYEAQPGPYEPRGSNGEGSMEFITGKPIPDETIRPTAVRVGTTPKGQTIVKAERESGMLPPPVRQRKVELSWRHGSLAAALASARRSPHPHGRRWVELPVLGTSAHVDTRAEPFTNQGGPGNRQMTAFWSEGGYLLELRAAVPDQAAFEDRLDWLTKVDSQAWLEAMPPSVVKAADHAAAVRSMLRSVPVPGAFNPSLIPGAGLTTDRGQVAAAVTGTVSCLWLRQWGQARRTGDRAKAAEAERAMATYARWPVFRELDRKGRYPSELIKALVPAMPTGHYEWRKGKERRLLPYAEGLGCAREGIPLLPWKQRRQREGATASS